MLPHLSETVLLVIAHLTGQVAMLTAVHTVVARVTAWPVAARDVQPMQASR